MSFQRGRRVETSDPVPARTIHGLLPLENAMRAPSGLPGGPDAPGVGACSVYLGDVRPVDIALAGRIWPAAGLALVAAEPPAPAGT